MISWLASPVNLILKCKTKYIMTRFPSAHHVSGVDKNILADCIYLK
jgi:hypothetical protein